MSHDTSTAATELAEALKAKAIELCELFACIDAHIDEQHQEARAAMNIDEMKRLTAADPLRWLADAKHNMQSGVMFALRAVEQPVAF